MTEESQEKRNLELVPVNDLLDEVAVRFPVMIVLAARDLTQQGGEILFDIRGDPFKCLGLIETAAQYSRLQTSSAVMSLSHTCDDSCEKEKGEED